MAMFSLSGRRKLTEFGLSVALIYFTWFLQLTILSLFNVKDVMCSLPLTLTIVWGAVFGSRLPALTSDEISQSSLSDVILRQAVAGSLSAALVGGTFGALYSCTLPVYPIYLPMIGWISGYFCLKNFSQATFLTIPIVFLATILGETLMALQLMLLHRPDVIQHLVQIAVPEAAVNAIIAPLVFLPLRGWYDFSKNYLSVADEHA
jgi:rod shape-determining protein MreD